MTSSADSSAADSPYVGTPGPGFDPEAQVTVQTDVEAAEAPQVPQPFEEAQVRELLAAAGDSAHLLLGVGEQDWKMIAEDLRRMAPPATRIANRLDPTGRVAQYSDPLLFAHGAFCYALRSMQERRAILKAQEAGKRPPALRTPEQSAPYVETQFEEVDELEVEEEEAIVFEAADMDGSEDVELSMAPGQSSFADRLRAAHDAEVQRRQQQGENQ